MAKFRPSVELRRELSDQANGLTPIGRVTVALLRLNRDYVLNLRKLLMLAGEHPPL